jgi:epoxyqueuosine reductase QueG
MSEKHHIAEFAKSLGAEDVGFADPDVYDSPRCPGIRTVFPEIKSIIVMAYRELSSCESDCMQIAMNGRMDLMDYSRGVNYRVATYIERELGGRAMTVPVSYPLPMMKETQGAVADVSTRHAAVAAGLGVFGRNNLVLHPRLGCRSIFTCVLADVEFSPDEPLTEELCDECGICVENCPGGALDEEGKTDVLACLKHCQPYGIGGNIRFWWKFAEAGPEERQRMLADENYWRLYQAQSIGFQYFCFNCIKDCPVGRP